MPLLAEGDVTVHKLLPGADPKDPEAGYSSVTLGPGDSLGEDEVPLYVLEKVKLGQAGPLVKVSKEKAEKAFAEAEKAREEAELGNKVVNGSNSEEDMGKE